MKRYLHDFVVIVCWVVILGSGLITCQKKGCDCPNYSPVFPQASLASPANNSIFANRCPNLNWREAVDPDGDKIYYYIFFGEDANKLLLLDTSLSAYYYVPCDLKPSTKYYWQIVASDTHGNTDTSEVWNFTTQP